MPYKLNEKIEEEYEFEPISVVEYTNYVFTNEYSLFGKEKKVSFEENEHLKDKPLLQVENILIWISIFSRYRISCGI